MRVLSAALLVAACTACTNDGTFQYNNTLHADTRGVVLHDDGESGQAGMYGTTCAVYTDGGVGEDYDYPSDSETVDDVGFTADGPAVLIRSELGLHVQPPLGGWSFDHVDVPVRGAQAGRFVDSGLVALISDGGSCSVAWLGDAGASAQVPSDLCVGSTFTADPTTGTAWVAGPSGVWQATPEGAQQVDATGELVAWDSVAGVLYVAEVGSITVQAIEPDGGMRWTAEVDGAITALDDLGARGAAVVSARSYGGQGYLFVIDGFTGEVESKVHTPEAASEVTSSGNGATVAVVVPSKVHFLRVQP